MTLIKIVFIVSGFYRLSKQRPSCAKTGSFRHSSHSSLEIFNHQYQWFQLDNLVFLGRNNIISLDLDLIIYSYNLPTTWPYSSLFGLDGPREVLTNAYSLVGMYKQNFGPGWHVDVLEIGPEKRVRACPGRSRQNASAEPGGGRHSAAAGAPGFRGYPISLPLHQVMQLIIQISRLNLSYDIRSLLSQLEDKRPRVQCLPSIISLPARSSRGGSSTVNSTWRSKHYPVR